MLINRQDLLYSIRSIRRAPMLSLVAAAALTVGIGLNAGVFTLLNTVFLMPPTRKDPGSFVQVYPRYEGWFTGAGQFSSFTTEDFEAIRAHSQTLEDSAAWNASSMLVDHGPEHVAALLVSCSYFHVFGVDRPLIGRFFNPVECRRGSAVQVGVLSEPFWKSHFGADAKIVGKTVHLNGLAIEVIGVVPANEANMLSGGVFVPYTLQPVLDRSNNLFGSADSPWLDVAGRLRAGYSKQDVVAELATIMRRQDRTYVERKVSTFNRNTSVVLTNGSFVNNPLFHDLAVVLIALILGPLTLVLLLACSNVTMLFLSRAIVRRGEIAIRLALGVGRARLLRMLLLESLIMTAVAGIASIALAYRVPLLLTNMIDPNQSELVIVMHPNWRVFGYLAGLVGIATVVSSLAPMHAAWKLDLLTALKGREGAATARSRMTGGLIIAQIGMSFVLLSGAVLFGRIPRLVTGMDPGFETRHTLAVSMNVNTSAQNRDAALAFHQAIESRIRAIPKVQSLAYATLRPFRQPVPSEIRLPGEAKEHGRPASVDVVTREFFTTFGIPLMEGRGFAASDEKVAGGNSVALVSHAFARQFWPGADPVGRVVVTANDRRLTVIGVVADTRSERFGILDGPRLYELRDAGSLDGGLYVRFAGNASDAENAVMDALKAVDPTQSETPRTIWESLEENAEALRSLARIILVMALIAVMLAITGVYGVLSFAVNQRTREFGLKMVLGANRASIFKSIMARGARQIALGLVTGVALAEPALWLFTRLLKRSPLPVQSFDVSVFGIAAVLLAGVAMVAMFWPALRATQVDPVKALRTD